jgi:hypothetical protein
MVLRLKARESRSLPGLRSALGVLVKAFLLQIMSDQTFLFPKFITEKDLSRGGAAR